MTYEQEALEILAPMHKAGIEKYMWEPVVGGRVIINNYVDIITRIEGNSEVCIMDIKVPQYWTAIRKHYIPTMTQLWETVLEFNEEQKPLLAFDHSIICKSFYLYKLKKEFPYTDIDSLYLALLKVCLEIWKIKQEAQ